MLGDLGGEVERAHINHAGDQTPGALLDPLDHRSEDLGGERPQHQVPQLLVAGAIGDGEHLAACGVVAVQ
ncbi:hypothetical protein [Amycolatopsis plumensis]|uniref:hypothetical protein n=1 Tax=Amycolatopsis plumensis TaxID=236508 RepID=UPI00360C4273